MPYNLTRSIIVEKYIFIYLFTSHLHTSFKKCHKMYRVIQVRIIRDDRKKSSYIIIKHTFVYNPPKSFPTKDIYIYINSAQNLQNTYDLQH